MKQIYFSILAVGVVGCFDKVGTEGNLSMSYDHGFLERASTPVATGLQALVSVSAVNSEAPVLVTDVFSNDESVIAIQEVSESGFEMTANAQGSTAVHVHSDAGNDSFIFEVKDIGKIAFSDIVTVSTESAYPIVGAQIPIRRTIYDVDEGLLTGFGLTSVEITPAESAELIADTKQETLIVQVNEVGDFAIGFADDSTTYSAIALDEITNWVVQIPSESQEVLQVKDSFAITIYGETVNGYVGLTHLASADDSVCSVMNVLEAASFYSVSAMGEGTCTIKNGVTGEVIFEKEVVP